MKKEKFKRKFIKRVFTRFHMFLILIGTALTGVIFSRILLLLGLEHMIIRFIIVLILAYLSFFVLMRLWLSYLTRPYEEKGSPDGLLDAAGIISDISSGTDSVFKGGGGMSGGGGASGQWDVCPDTIDAAGSEGITGTAESVGDAVETVSDAAGLAEEGGIALIFLGLLLLVILGGSVYLIYEAPVIISEAAFELVLAGSLIKKARAIDNPNWAGSIFRSTWPAFLLTLIVAIVAGWGFMSYCPEARKVSEIMRSCM